MEFRRVLFRSPEDSRHRCRDATRDPLYGGYAGGAVPALSECALRLADGCRQPRPVPPLGPLAGYRAQHADGGARPAGPQPDCGTEPGGALAAALAPAAA